MFCPVTLGLDPRVQDNGTRTSEVLTVGPRVKPEDDDNE